MIIDNNPLGMEAVKASEAGDKEKAHELEAEFIRQFQEEFAAKGSHCSCKEPCRWHGMCRECIAIHRAEGYQLPNCLKEEYCREL